MSIEGIIRIREFKEFRLSWRQEKKVIYNNNPKLKWCLLNTSVETDKNDNIRPIKGKKSKQRIDGAVSLIDAYCVLFEKMNDYLSLQEE